MFNQIKKILFVSFFVAFTVLIMGLHVAQAEYLSTKDVGGNTAYCYTDGCVKIVGPSFDVGNANSYASSADYSEAVMVKATDFNKALAVSSKDLYIAQRDETGKITQVACTNGAPAIEVVDESKLANPAVSADAPVSCTGGRVLVGTSNCVCPEGDWDGTSCVIPPQQHAEQQHAEQQQSQASCGAGTVMSFGVCTPCPAPQVEKNGVCVMPPSTNATALTCDGGRVLVGTNCECPAGEEFNGLICIAKKSTNATALTCDGGRVLVGTNCECPAGEEFNGLICVAKKSTNVCPDGYVLSGSVCVKENGQCLDEDFCSGSNVYHQSALCVLSFVKYCPYGCEYGECLSRAAVTPPPPPPPPPTATIKAAPGMVRSGESSHVSWDSEYTTQCSVRGTNGDSWSGTSGVRTSGAIRGKTTFTVSCTGLDGSTAQASAQVSLIPSYQER